VIIIDIPCPPPVGDLTDPHEEQCAAVRVITVMTRKGDTRIDTSGV